MTMPVSAIVDTSVPELFRQQAQRNPHALAVVDDFSQLTYQQLDVVSNQIAHQLMQCGVRPGQYIGISMERTPRMIAALLGILKAGAGYVPLDPSYPEERHVFMLQDADVRVVLTDDSGAERLEQVAAQARLINVAGSLDAAADDPRTEIPQGCVACLMYTSGSTGRPKGVMVTHRGIVRLVRNTDYCRFDSTEVFLHMAPLAFDASTFEIWGPLLNGARLALVPPGLPAIDVIGDTICRHHVTTMWLTAGLFHLIVDERPEILKPLRQLLAGGDVLSPRHIETALQVLDDGVIINGYGPTECTTFACCFLMEKGFRPQGTIPIGKPIANTHAYILDEHLQPLPAGEEGELYLGGPGVALGYLNRPELTQERFLEDPFCTEPGAKMYRTGDRVCLGSDGQIRFLGRCDDQVKISGHRIEPGEIEAALCRQPGIREAAVVARQLTSGEKQLVAYVVSLTGHPLGVSQLRKQLSEQLPSYMVPSRFVELERLPLNANGKVSRRELPDPDQPSRPQLAMEGDRGTTKTNLSGESGDVQSTSPPQDDPHSSPVRTARFDPEPLASPADLTSSIRDIWKDVLGCEVDLDANFFDLGGKSLQLMDVHARLTRSLLPDLVVTDLFAYPTVRSLARSQWRVGSETGSQRSRKSTTDCLTAQPSTRTCRRSLRSESCDIAIVGMAGRWPGARSVDEFWQHMRSGTECISRFSANETEARDPSTQAADYVRARSILEDADRFDAAFFGILPREAELIDPQHRVFLEISWEALESAGYDPEKYSGAIGVFAGCSVNTYFLNNLCRSPGFIEEFVGSYPLGQYGALLGGLNDCLATRVSYKLNLRGPSATVQSACSTSLVAISQACLSLCAGQSDMVLAGGVSITFPQRRGYRYQAGGMGSADGYCRPFDARSCGTVFGSGAGVVLLKRLEDALRDGDCIHSVIKGFAVNNDGSGKVGFTAPSVDGQAAVIAAAHEMAQVDLSRMVYLEAHGTATPLGDPIEFRALNQALAGSQAQPGTCALASVKARLGHLEAAAGVTGLIHAANVLRHGEIPAAVDHSEPHPEIPLHNSPFYVNNELRVCREVAGRRAAGVSSFGVGGTNVHLVLEQAPTQHSDVDCRPQLLPLSARSADALAERMDDLRRHLESQSDINLDAVAWTLQDGRREFPHRLAIPCRDVSEAIHLLKTATRDAMRVHEGDPPEVVFMFPGQGAQYVGMGQQFYQSEPAFRADVDACAQMLMPHLGVDIRHAMFADEHSQVLNLTETQLAQSALFVLEFALARQFERWGITPTAMIGHSLGEFVAACLAGVFTLESALEIVAKRGTLMQQLPPGAMLSVRMAEESLRPWLTEGLSLAAANAPQLNVVSGPLNEIERLEERLGKAGVVARRLATSHAFHSSMVDPAVAPFLDVIRGVDLHPPQRPFVSGVTGDWITSEMATDPMYWARHLREPVLFSKGVQFLQSHPGRVFVEVGPGRALSTLVRQHRAADREGDATTITTLVPDADSDDSMAILQTIGRLWLQGITPNWRQLHGSEVRRCPLPTYPFQRQRFWIEPTGGNDSVAQQSSVASIAARDNEPAGRTSGLAFPSQTELPVSASSAAAISTLHDSGLPDSDFRPTDNCEIPMSVLSSAVPSTACRHQRLQEAVSRMLEELSGVSLTAADATTSFLELGFDSLFLTQVTQCLQEKFGLKITFRQLMDQQSTVESLAGYLDAELPAEAFAPPVPEAAPAPPVQSASAPVLPAAPAMPSSAELIQSASVATSADSQASQPGWVPGTDGVHSLLKDQLRAMSSLMEAQLQLLQGIPNTPIQKAVDPPALIPSLAGTPGPAGHQVSSKPVADSDSGETSGEPVGRFRPVRRGTTSLTQKQSDHVAALVRRYAAKTAGSKQMTQDRRSVLADPRAAAEFRSQWKEMVYPVVTVRSKGSRLWDLDGNEYVDVVNGFGPILFGHGEIVREAVAAQLEIGFETGPQTPLAGECAELIRELTGNERVTFCNTGSEAIMAALRVTRTVSGRNNVVIFENSYHGIADEVLARSAPRDRSRSLPIAPGIPRGKVENIIVLEYARPESLEYIRQHAHELAAVIVEPVQSRHPSLQPIEFLRELRAITAASETALVFDEVVTGFRVHPGGIQALFDIRADLITYGKVVGGGMPIGILAGRSKYMDALDGGMWQFGDDSFPEVGVTFFAGTFVRHPLALAAARAVLKHLKAQGPELQSNLGRRTEQLADRLRALFQEHSVPGAIEHFSSWFYVKVPSDQPSLSLLFFHLREKGVHIREGFPCFLTTSHSDSDLELIYRAFAESIAEMKAGGFFEISSQSSAETPVSPQNRPSANGKLPGTSQLPRQVSLTESQLEILLAAELSDEASCSFNEAVKIELHGHLDASAMDRALSELVVRHEALRSTIEPEGYQLLIRDPSNSLYERIDLTTLSSELRKSKVQEIISANATTPFDLREGPLARFQLLKSGPEHHTLLFTAHHIICDGWSINVLMDELGKLYSGRGSELTTPMPFREYAIRQASHGESEERRKVAAWWVEQFANPPAALELPTDRPRGAVKSFRGATVRRVVSAGALGRIKKFGARQGCTLFVTLLAGFTALIHRLTRQRDIVVGIPAAGQSQAGENPLVGHCVNFLPIRTRFDNDASPQSLLKGVRDSLLDAYENQDYTFGTLVRALRLHRDPARLPLVEIQFNLEQLGDGLSFQGLDVTMDSLPKSSVNFDLFLNVVESDSGLVMDCDFNSDLFDAATVTRWLEYLEKLLEEMGVHPQEVFSRLNMASESELRALTVSRNDTSATYARERCVHDVISRQAADSAERVAAVCGSSEYTYARLERESNRLAHYLHLKGVRKGDLVGICTERSLDMLVSVLAVLKSGAAYVPLDPEFPEERIGMVIEDARPRLVLTQRKLAGLLRLDDPDLVCLDEEQASISAMADTQLQTECGAEDLAYVIFTSGSTGRPKGVEIPHRAVVNLLTAMSRKPGMTPHDTLLAVTTLSFDISVLELLLPLTVGGRVHIATREQVVEGIALRAVLESSAATIMQATPATWRMLIDADWEGSPEVKVLCGGEALQRNLADQLLDRAASVWNMYGPTETTVWSAVLEVTPGNGPIPLGPPIENTQFYVLDEDLLVVPMGVPGELHIGGDGLARGYRNQADLTSERFIENPFASDLSSRLYKTGDMVRSLADGTIQFLGRRDNQVKIRGYRIEIGEIELALRQCPQVHEGVVVVRQTTQGEGQLVACVVPESPQPLPDALREALSVRLPTYMIPSFFVFLDSLPQTPNGKIDRGSLAELDPGERQQERVAVAPRNPRETLLTETCCEVLSQSTLSVHDNLFDYGADSLAVSLIAALVSKAGLRISPGLIFAKRTIAAICETACESPPNGRPLAGLTGVGRERFRARLSDIHS